MCLGIRPSDLGLRIFAGLLITALALLTASPPLRAGFVYESPGEFLSAGDFNGDGILDVLVVDKATGNVRVGYQGGSSNLTWSAPLTTSVEAPDALTVGHFLQTNEDAIAITSIELNRVHFVDLSNPSNAPAPLVMAPNGLGPNLLVGLAAPYGSVSNFDSLLVGSADNNPDLGSTLIELWALVASGLTAYQDSIAQESYLARGNSLQLGADVTTFAAALQRGSNDQFVAYAPSNHFGILLSRSNLPSGSDYVFGQFNSELLPRFIFYVPGQSNITIQSLVPTNGGFTFDAGVSVVLSEAVQQVYYVSQGTDGSALILFGDGVQGMTLPGGTPTLASVYRTGAGAAGNVFTGVVPLSGGNFALLDGPPGSPTSAHAQVVHFNGSTYTQLSSGNLPALTTRNTRANVWLFQTEPFVSNDPGFISSLNAPDWSSGATISGGAVSALAETDAGPSSGLQNPTNDNLGALPAGAAWAIPDQYRDSISLFTYSSPRAPEAVNVTISPPAGLYGGPIQISFTTLNGGDQVFYRVGAADNWHSFGAPFALTNDATVQYYGTNATSASRSRLLAASYQFGRAGAVTPLSPLDLAPGSTNPAPVFRTNQVILSDLGTVFYGRRSSNDVATIWAINLDGSGETYITTGARPRVSRDGQWLAFLREGNVFTNRGNLWVRNLSSGLETRLFVSNPNPPNTNTLMWCDWDLTETNLIFDYDNTFWRIGLDGSLSQFPLASSYNQGAPAINPVDGRVAFHSLYPGTSALYLAPPDLSSKQLLLYSPTGARWPAWSPDGGYLALADGYVSPSVDDGKDLWVAELSGGTVSNLFRITALANSTNGFPHGAVWSPAEDALVTAGVIGGTNGIWVIPLNGDCMCSDAPVVRLPTAPGDAIDFVGSIIAAPAPLTVVKPGLFIRLDPDAAVVYWSSEYRGFTLEATTDLTPPSTWSALPGPYSFDGYYFQYRVPLASLLNKQFFRLHFTGTPQ
ncbi:MAG TPA: hypothetical protein VN578_25660 [Candidatus Binatia bacterium]|nr:hypothetical protein [Candidatus Binatia bacterium]